MDVEVQIPEGLNLEIRSNLASVYGKGTLEEILIQLKSGSCYLDAFSGNATVHTFNGDIEVITDAAVVGTNSRLGTIAVVENEHGAHHLHLSSINGNIRVRKTK